MEGQDELLMRNSGQTEGGLESNNAAFLEDVAQNADLYIANQDVSTRTQPCNLRSDVYVYSFKSCILIVATFISCYYQLLEQQQQLVQYYVATNI